MLVRALRFFVSIGGYRKSTCGLTLILGGEIALLPCMINETCLLSGTFLRRIKTMKSSRTHALPATSSEKVRGVSVLSGQALLDDMRAFSKEISATPESAKAFLVSMGVMTKSGKRKNLIRD